MSQAGYGPVCEWLANCWVTEYWCKDCVIFAYYWRCSGCFLVLVGLINICFKMITTLHQLLWHSKTLGNAVHLPKNEWKSTFLLFPTPHFTFADRTSTNVSKLTKSFGQILLSQTRAESISSIMSLWHIAQAKKCATLTPYSQKNVRLCGDF